MISTLYCPRGLSGRFTLQYRVAVDVGLVFTTLGLKRVFLLQQADARLKAAH